MGVVCIALSLGIASMAAILQIPDDTTFNKVHRPSSWPVRRERRQLAAAQFNAQLSDTLSAILQRLTRIEEKLEALHLPPPGLDLVNGIDLDIKRMEMLLFRLDMADFSKIDKIVQSCKALLEDDGSTESASGDSSTPSKEIRDHDAMDGAEMFNIFDLNIDQETQTDMSFLAPHAEALVLLEDNHAHQIDGVPKCETGVIETMIGSPHGERAEWENSAGGMTTKDRMLEADWAEQDVDSGQLQDEDAAHACRWRCYHCWTHLGNDTEICRFCKDKTVAVAYAV